MIDNFGRKINYLRFSVTDRCDLRCRYCMPTKNEKFFKKENIPISQQNINIIVDKCNGDRHNLNNELNKIKNYTLSKKKISSQEILRLINLSENFEISELIDNCLAFNKNKIINLTEKESRLLNFILENKENVVKKDEILINVWGITERINTHTLETHIYSLKKKLDAFEYNHSFICSDNLGGYYFNKIIK